MTIPNIGKYVEKLDHSYIVRGQMAELLWKTISQFLKKINMYYYTTRQLHSWMFIPQKWRQCSHKNLYNNVFRCFTCNIQRLETTRCPLTGEWLDKLCHIHTMEYYLSINYRYTQQPGWIFEEPCWVTSTDPKGYMVYGSFFFSTC